MKSIIVFKCTEMFLLQGLLVSTLFAQIPVYHGTQQTINSSAIMQETIDDYTEHTYSIPSIGIFSDATIIRSFSAPIKSITLTIVAGHADDVGYVGEIIVTPDESGCFGGGSVSGAIDVTSQVSVESNTASLILRGKETCCGCEGGWGEDNLEGSENARLHWVVTLNDCVDPTVPIVNSPICSGDQSVSGTSTEADGTEIYVFINGEIENGGSTTVNGGNWTKTFLRRFSQGDYVNAFAGQYGKCISNPSATVTVTRNYADITAQPSSPVCTNTSVYYATYAGETDYIWTFSGVSGTDYIITSGGTSSDNWVTLKWLTAAPFFKRVAVTFGPCYYLGISAQTTVLENTFFYADIDGDGFGNDNLATQACSAPTGFVSDNTDCDDSRASVYPGATEVCNGVDDNCDGQIDEGCATLPTVSINDVTVYESDGVAVLNVSLSKKSTSPITINYATADGTATSPKKPKTPKDYTAAKGTVIIPAGSQVASISIAIVQDNVTEPTEYFNVGLSLSKTASKQATISKGIGIVTILGGTRLVSTAIVQERNSKGSIKEQSHVSKLTVSVQPNPAYNYFKLITHSNSSQPLTVNIMDVVGRTIETRKGIPANGILQIGYSYRPGNYFVQLVQGKDIVTVKLIKQSE